MAGGGIGEATLMSAVIGGGLSAAKGEDPLKGALLGGLMHGATGGIGNLLSPTAPALAGNILAPAATTAVTEAALAPVAETALTGGLSSIPLEGQLSSSALADLTSGIPTRGIGTQIAGELTPDMFPPEVLQQAGLASDTIPSALQAQQDSLVNAASQIPRGVPESSGGLGSFIDKFNTLSMPEKLLYGSTAALAAPVVMNMFKGKKEIGGEEEYDGPLKKFKYNPNRYTPLEVAPPTPYQARYAAGGIANLGRYSDYARGGRMLKGPGDGMSDDIPATIAGKQPARLANEEFVVPADVVSHLGNGSSEAGAKQLYKMMERVRKARTGNKKQGKQINPERYLA